MEKSFGEGTPRRPIFSRHSPYGAKDEADGAGTQAGVAGFRNTNVIPTLRKTGRRQGRFCLYLFG